jgi:hypothetical protein
MLPPLDQRGLLPIGVHIASISEIEVAFAINSPRQHLLAEFRLFLRERLVAVAADLDLFMCGSYLTDKAMPEDVDCMVPIPVTMIATHTNLMALLNDGRTTTVKGAIWDQYRVHIWPNITGIPGVPDFAAFFQYVGHKSAAMKNLNATDRRGIVKVEQWTLG